MLMIDVRTLFTYLFSAYASHALRRLFSPSDAVPLCSIRHPVRVVPAGYVRTAELGGLLGSAPVSASSSLIRHRHRATLYMAQNQDDESTGTAIPFHTLLHIGIASSLKKAPCLT